MAQLFPGLRQLTKLSGNVSDAQAKRALRNLEDWAELIVRELAAAEGSTGGITLPIAQSDVTGLVAALAAKVDTSRTISTTSPLAGGGDLSANRTLTVADNSTASKGVVAQAPNDTSQFWRGDASWSSFPFSSWLCGDGYDGDVTLEVDTTLSGGDKFYNNLTVGAGVRLNVAGRRVFVKNTLTLNGVIHSDGQPGANGVASGGATGGSGGTGFYISGGSKGGNSGAVDGTAHSVMMPRSTTTSSDNKGAVGNVPGRGGGGGVSALGGGAGGAVTVTADNLGHPTPLALLYGCPERSTTQWQGGTGGGGGGNGGTGTGGAGGGGGGCVVVVAKTITGTGSISANGGVGGDAYTPNTSGGSGGGGGGGGGWVAVFYGTKADTITIEALGGLAGASVGTAGPAGAGADGFTYVFNISGDGT